MINFISWLIFGLIIGALAKLFVRGPNDFRGCLPTVILGILGAVVGGFIGRELGMFGGREGFGHFVMAILGAVLVLIVYRAIFGRSVPD